MSPLPLQHSTTGQLAQWHFHANQLEVSISHSFKSTELLTYIWPNRQKRPCGLHYKQLDKCREIETREPPSEHQLVVGIEAPCKKHQALQIERFTMCVTIFFSSVVKNWELWAKFTADEHPLSSVTLEMGWLQLSAPLECHRLPLDCRFGAEVQRMVRRHILADHISDSM